MDSTKPAPPTLLRGALGKSVGFVLEECFPKLASVRAASGLEILRVESPGSAAPGPPSHSTLAHLQAETLCGSVQPPAASHPEPKRGAARGEDTTVAQAHRSSSASDLKSAVGTAFLPREPHCAPRTGVVARGSGERFRDNLVT